MHAVIPAFNTDLNNTIVWYYILAVSFFVWINWLSKKSTKRSIEEGDSEYQFENKPSENYTLGIDLAAQTVNQPTAGRSLFVKSIAVLIAVLLVLTPLSDLIPTLDPPQIIGWTCFGPILL